MAIIQQSDSEESIDATMKNREEQEKEMTDRQNWQCLSRPNGQESVKDRLRLLHPRCVWQIDLYQCEQGATTNI